MVALLLFVMSLLFMLSSFKFQTVLTNLISNRLSATSPTIYESIEAALDLGLGLGEIRNTESVIRRVQKNNPGIRSIDIFDIRGQVLYSTEEQRVAKPIAPYILENLETAPGHHSQLELDENFLSAFKLLNNYDQRVGGGTIIYSKDDYNHQVASFRNSLLIKSGMVFAAFAVLASLGIMLAFRGLRKYLNSIEDSHETIRESEANGQNVCFINTNGLPAVASENALIRMDDFDDRLCTIERNIANAAAALDTLEVPEASNDLEVSVTPDDDSYDQQTELASHMARPLILIMMGALLLSSVIFAYASYTEFGRFLEPELQKKAQLIALNIDQDLTKAIEVGIPFEQLVGVDDYLDSIAAEFAEVTYLEIQDQTRTTWFQSGQSKNTASGPNLPNQSAGTDGGLTPARDRSGSINYNYPLKIDDTNSGYINVGLDQNFVRRQLDSIIYDNLVILIVAVLVAFQIMTALFLYYVTGPIERLNMLINLQVQGNFSKFIKTRGGDSVGKVTHYLSQCARQLNEQFRERRYQLKEAAGDALHRIDQVARRYGLAQTKSPTPLIRASVSDIRIPLFLFAFAEELQKSFLPIFVRQLYEPHPWLNESVVISLPIVVWLTIVGLAAPFSGQWSQRFGSRNIFLCGLIPSVIGFVGCSMSQTILQFVLWRGATALGYAMITIACQDYLLGKNVAGSRNVNIAIFVGIVITATMCGTAIGGILAARIGYQSTFLIAAGLMLFAGFAGYRMLSQEAGAGSEAAEKLSGGLEALRMIFKNREFVVFLFCIAIPTNILMAAYLWYLVPLYLFDLDATTAEIGRTMMIYYLLIIVIGAPVSKRVKTPKGLTLLVGLGTLLSGFGLATFHRWHNFWAVVLSVTFLGLSHAMTKAPQITLSLEICRSEVQKAGHNVVLGSLRVLERFGSICGLIIGAVMIDSYGYQNATGVAGIGVCAASIIFILFFFIIRRINPDETESRP